MRSSTRWSLWLLALVLALRSLVPTGWMPTAGDDGIRVLLCTGSGPVALVLHPGGDHRDGDHRDGDGAPGEIRDPCPFAVALGKAAPPPPPDAEIAPAVAHAQAHVAMLATIGAIVRRSLRPPARGPPLSV